MFISYQERDQQQEKERNNQKGTDKGWSNSKGKEEKQCYIVKEGVTNEKSTSDNYEDKDEVSFVGITNERVESALITSTSSHKNQIINSDCSHHMSCGRSKFHEVEAYDRGMVKFGNNLP